MQQQNRVRLDIFVRLSGLYPKAKQFSRSSATAQSTELDQLAWRVVSRAAAYSFWETRGTIALCFGLSASAESQILKLGYDDVEE